MRTRGWQFWVDRGGTFTDIVARSPSGELSTRKLLSDNPRRYADATVAGIAAILEDRTESPQIDAIKMGTTVATNALLERHGEPTVLVITAGFGDALRIGYQQRPDIFALELRVPQVPCAQVIEARERVTADGQVRLPLDRNDLRRELKRCRAAGFRSVAICLLHAWRYSAHEAAAGALARELGFEQISLSHEANPLIKLVSRGDTTVIDAYLSPVLRHYIDGLQTALRAAALVPRRLMFMQSNGGLVDQSLFRGKDSMLSGPAGGVVGMVATARGVVGDKLIGFDMGGTSTDVTLFSRRYDYVEETQIAGLRMRAPMLHIHTVAAGGGSMLRFESGRFQVGPESAGARPGPACYRNGGPLTITDANLLLGNLVPRFFPPIFGSTGDLPLDDDAARTAFTALAREIAAETGHAIEAEAVAAGFLRVAIDNMANAIKTVSIQRGFDAREFTLCCFGGAGGQHACGVADQLGIRTILIDPLAGLLSAYGMGAAPLRTYIERSVEAPVTDALLAGLPAEIDGLAADCRHRLVAQGAADRELEVTAWLNLRAAGTDTTLPVRWRGRATLRADFAAIHAERFGFEPADAELFVASLRVEAAAEMLVAAAGPAIDRRSTAPALGQTRLWRDGRWQSAAVYRWESLVPDTRIAGLALIVADHSMTVVEIGWRLLLNDRRQILLTRDSRVETGAVATTRPDPVMLEVFNNHFMHVAEQMGVVLEKTAHSVNIKERLDFSCALFDGQGRLIANAPHIPVHLGSMGDSVAAVLSARREDLQPGDAVMLNDPYAGGTHLPDVTVVTPVLDGPSVRFVVACRAHHADIGGTTPGSMPPFSRHIDEEGVLFTDFLLVRDGRFRETELRDHLAGARYPARNPDRNVADLRAQLAANEKGVRELAAMVGHFGLATVQAYMQHVQDNAEESVRRVIDRLEDGEFSLRMDGGEIIRVTVRVDRSRREALLDFSGTSAQSPGNLNAPLSVARAAVLYVFRTLVDRPIPLNAGCLKPLQLRAPEPSLLHPHYPAAVAAGNVETSQAIVNALYGAMRIMAAGQGTMNNLTFGNDRYQYYETIGGGTGAGPDFPGADAVHSHMTNSRMTDPEVLEVRFPVLIRSFGIRRLSGGRGRQRGGDGILREIEFLEPMDVAMISGHRQSGPFGLDGGGSGQPGRNRVMRATGDIEELAGTAAFRVEQGDVLSIETPGGGAFGAVDAPGTDR